MATAASTAIFGRAELWINFGSGPIQIPDVMDISGFGVDTAFIDVYHQSSPSQTAEFIKGKKTPKKFSVTCSYSPTNTVMQSILTDANADSASTYLRAMELVFNTSPSKKCTFSGLIGNPEVTPSGDAQLKLKFDIQISGPVTWPS